MRPLLVQPEGIVQLLVDGLYNLPQANYPTSQLFGPGLAAVSLGRADHLGAVIILPVLMPLSSFKSLVHHIIAHGWLSYGRPPRLGIMAEGEEVLGHGLVFGAGWGKTEPSDDSLGISRDQQMEPFVPTQAVAPADVGLTRQPTSASTLGISGRNPSAVQGCVGTILGLEPGRQIAKESDDGLIMPPHQAVELTTVGQGGEGRAQMVPGVAVEASLAEEATPLTERARVTTSLRVKEGLGPGVFSGGSWYLQKSSAIT